MLWLNTAKESTPKLTRWSLLLQEYRFRVEHCPGDANELPDLLSRQPTGEPAEEGDLEDADRLFPPDAANAITETPSLQDVVVGAQQADQQAQEKVQRLAQHPSRWWSVAEGRLLLRGKLFVPPAAREAVLQAYHGSQHAGHPGGEETLRAILRHYTWPKAKQAVGHWVSSCSVCTATKRGPLEPPPPLLSQTPAAPFEVIALDLMGPYEPDRRRYSYILTITDLFSKWTEAFPLKQARTPRIVKLLHEEVFMRYGFPKTLITDNGPQFTNFCFQKKLSEWRVKHQTTAIYHPRANPTERKNQDIKKNLNALRQENPDTPWSELLPTAAFQLRTRVNAATNRTPAEVVFGRRLRTPIDPAEQPGDGQTPQQRYATIRARTKRYKQRYAQGRLRNTPPVNVGDLVWVRSRLKGLNPRWLGPRKIIDDAGGHCYWVQGESPDLPPSKLHRLDIRPAPPQRQTAEPAPTAPPTPPTPPPPTQPAPTTPTAPPTQPAPPTPPTPPASLTAPPKTPAPPSPQPSTSGTHHATRPTDNRQTRTPPWPRSPKIKLTIIPPKK